MFSLKKQKGFTIVELLIVIIVIAILATLVIMTFSGIQQKGRDAQRRTDIGAIQAAVTAFYTEKGYYPTAADLNDATFRTNNTKGLDPEALRDPKQAASDANIGTADATATSTTYGYVASGGASCTNTAASVDGTTTCSNFKITAHLESDNSIYTKQSSN